ncbi:MULTISPECIES: cytochrome c-550 PedF [unclassified Marinovum]
MFGFATKGALTALVIAGSAGVVLAAGLPLGISSVDTGSLPQTGDEWLTENPYRVEASSQEVWNEAIEIGASGYNQNCARCHGLEAVSGGLAPDLRFLEAEEYGDEWFIERFREGYTQNGTTKMPEFGELLGQDAAWAIRTYVETRPDQDAVEELTPELKGLRDQLAGWAADGSGADSAGAQARLAEIAGEIETLSGAPVADSVAYRAANLLSAKPEAYEQAAEILTIGLSAAN